MLVSRCFILALHQCHRLIVILKPGLHGQRHDHGAQIYVGTELLLLEGPAFFPVQLLGRSDKTTARWRAIPPPEECAGAASAPAPARAVQCIGAGGGGVGVGRGHSSTLLLRVRHSASGMLGPSFLMLPVMISGLVLLVLSAPCEANPLRRYGGSGSAFRYNSYDTIVSRLKVRLNPVAIICSLLICLTAASQALNSANPGLVELFDAQQSFGIRSPGTCSEIFLSTVSRPDSPLHRHGSTIARRP